ncbi:MAG: TldD/PmbA family protein [Tumebacillaceae bacterium]
MDVREFQTKLFAKGYEAGYTDMEVYYQADRATTVRVFKGNIDAYNIAEKGGLAFRGVIDGKMGYSYTEKLDEDSIELLLAEARENAVLIEAQDQDELFGGSERYQEVNTYSESLAATTAEQLIEAALKLERTAYEVDSRIDLVNYCTVTNAQSELTIINTKGLDVQSRETIAAAMLGPVAKENGDIASAGDSGYTLDEFSHLDVTHLAQTAAEEALSKLNAQTIESDNYPVILRNDAAADLLGCYTSIFSAEDVEKGLSRLQGKLGEQVAGSNISIVDDPFLPSAPGRTAFDSEGSATSRHELIKDGKLMTFLHNRKSAKKAGVESTGNAYKGSYRGTGTIKPNNLFIEPGEASLDELTAGIERGLLIVELQGLHSGHNAVSGDFSLASIGYLIENGKIVRPVNQITVSGNFFELLNSVEAIGNDLRFSGFGRGACGSPSLKIKALTVSGK